MALVGDSTNAMVEGRTLSESVAQKGLTEAIADAKHAVAVTLFASNVARIKSIIAAAQANGRSVCVAGRALTRTISAAKEVGYLKDIPDFVPETEANLIPSLRPSLSQSVQQRHRQQRRCQEIRL